MTVNNLRDLLKDAPDDLTVMFSHDGTFHVPNKDASGVATFGEATDEEGNPVEETLPEAERTFFLIVTHFE